MRLLFQPTPSRLMGAFVFSLVAVVLVGFAYCQVGDDSTFSGDDLTAGMRVSEPVVFKNLAVYFIHSDKRDDQEYLTLNDGLKQGLVVVTEKKQEQVSELLIENKSDKPLFLQEGDRVTGGKQDRTIYSSLVIKPKSGLMPIPTFCVEQSRWAVGEKGKSFDFNSNQAYASNMVRSASKLGKSQGEVWRQVGNAKAQLQQAIGNRDSTSSLNESLDSKNAAVWSSRFTHVYFRPTRWMRSLEIIKEKMRLLSATLQTRLPNQWEVSALVEWRLSLRYLTWLQAY